MHEHGHDIRGIYMSGKLCLIIARYVKKYLMLDLGSQAKNVALMQLMSDTCNVPVIIPHSASATVVLGAAMLGRFAAEVSKLKQGLDEEETRQRLWNIMVRPIDSRIV